MLQELIEEDEETIDNKWRKVKEVMTATCSDVLGPVKYHHKDWLSTETMKKIQDRKEKKAAVNNSRTRAERSQAQEAYSQANKTVKKSIRSDKRNYMDSLATKAEEAARNGNMKDLYNTTKKLSGKFSKPDRPVKDKDGKTLMGDEQQRNRWKEHFEELLNRPAPTNPPDLTPAADDLPIDCNTPTRQEIRKAIEQIKNGKAAGPDSIPAEALKADLDTTVEMLFPLFEKIWEEEQIPSDWKEGYLIKLPKKGDLSN